MFFNAYNTAHHMPAEFEDALLEDDLTELGEAGAWNEAKW